VKWSKKRRKGGEECGQKRMILKGGEGIEKKVPMYGLGKNGPRGNKGRDRGLWLALLPE